VRTVIVGCDNAGVGLKNILVKHMQEQDINIIDVGCETSEDNTYYPYIAKKVCDKIIENDYKVDGMLICGTGLGMAMTANKFKGIRAAVCHDIFSVTRAKLSNNANVICMGERVLGVEVAKRILDEWLSLNFVDGSSTDKVQAIIDIENINLR
jgi:ribose 5-phosphate isomerase B